MLPDEILERVIGMLKSRKDRSSVSLVCKEWYNAERWSRRNVFIELRLKRMTVTDESLKFLVRSFPNSKAISLQNCDGFSTDGLAAIAADCKNLMVHAVAGIDKP
ncbi:transport inhibitor response 1-like protein Os11g0515500 [Arachis ipaensis]|uniref:transport inhibitor response 1-like protein Os11g0515500 n=1 Tax=Arachis ipaensis TaxID=130454 RepID=UPI000A2B0FFA|nr:transport inhibitor response 1-like protein Os11g0515500 [Arachis ipaensis]XP_020968565.1 transport inhibitor response 1-like protein Os11g0515500 [Arachis ipaensis]